MLSSVPSVDVYLQLGELSQSHKSLSPSFINMDFQRVRELLWTGEIDRSVTSGQDSADSGSTGNKGGMINASQEEIDALEVAILRQHALSSTDTAAVNDLESEVDMDVCEADQLMTLVPAATGQGSPFAVQWVGFHTGVTGGGLPYKEMSHKAAWKDSVDQLVEDTGVGGTKTENDEFFYDSELSAPFTSDQPPHFVRSEATVADQATLVTSADDQPRTVSLPAVPSEEDPTTQAYDCGGTATTPSPKLVLVKKFERPDGEHLTPGILQTVRKETGDLKVAKLAMLFTMLSDFLRLPPGTMARHRVDGEQALDRNIGREEYNEFLTNSRLTVAAMTEVIAFLMYVQSKMGIKLIGKTFFMLCASCLIGKGRYYCHAGKNSTKQAQVLEAVYEAIIGKKPRKQRTTTTH